MIPPLQLLAPDQSVLVESLLLSPVFRLHLECQPSAPRLNWRQVRDDGHLPPQYRDWAARVFRFDLTQFWAYGQIGNCSVTTPLSGVDHAAAVFQAIPGRDHLTHLEVLVGNRTCSASISASIPRMRGGHQADEVNRLRRIRFFNLNRDRFPGTVTAAGVEHRVLYRDADDPERPRARDLAGEACRHLQNLCGVVFWLRTAETDLFALADRDLSTSVHTALRWCSGPEPDSRQLRLPEGLAHLMFDPRTTEAFPLAVRLATSHALDEYRARALPMPLVELNAVAHDDEQNPDDLVPFGLEMADDLRRAHDLLAPVWRTHRLDISHALGELKATWGYIDTPHPAFGPPPNHGPLNEEMPDPEGWNPHRV